MSPQDRNTKTASLHRRFLRLTIINIASNLTIPLVGLVDTAMLGHLTEIRFLAGVALASLVFDYLYWGFGFLRMATTGTTAQAVGRGDRHEVMLCLYRGVTLGLAIGIGLVLLQRPLADAGFALLSGEPGVEAAGREYYEARIFGAPAALCNFALLGWFLGREQSGRALVVTVVGNLANVALNYVFIVRLGMAAFGAGLASMISQYLMLLCGAAFALQSVGQVPWRWREVVQGDSLRSLFALNGNLFVRTLCLISAFALFTNFSAVLGTTILAANAILLRVLNLAAYMIDGAAFATESLAGIFRGRREGHNLMRLLWLSLVSGEVFAAIFLLPLLVLPSVALRALTSHEDVIGMASAYAWWLLPVLVFGAVAYMLDGFFLGLTQGAILRNSMLVSGIVVFVPLSWWALRWGDNHLLWFSLTALMVARAATLGFAARRYLVAIDGRGCPLPLAGTDAP